MIESSGNQILVVNAGGQYCHLIARRVRETGVKAKICSPEEAANEMRQAKGIIISGGPSSVYAADAPHFPKALFSGDVPILGICYGHQVLAANLAGKVQAGQDHEYGEAVLDVIGHDTILQGLGQSEIVWMSHGDEVVATPPGFQILARSGNCSIAAMADLKRNFFGLQFHPEVTDTRCGKKIIENFVFGVCQCEKDWQISQLVARLKESIRQEVRDRHVLFLVSGGVDSTVAFSLCTDALAPESVTGVFVDTGFMRKNERAEIEEAFQRKGWNNVLYLEEASRFLTALEGIVHPEEKRRRIGECFLEVQRDLEKRLGFAKGGWMLGQGTIYPDTIESGGNKNAAVIKTHHNRVPGIEKMIREGLILEPLKEFYKDEVRDIGRQLGLPESIVAKNPFPGPGLAVRCLCSDEEHPVRKSAEAETVAKRFGLSAWTAQVRTVGVQGDHRSYSDLVILSGHGTLEEYAHAARDITREIRGVNRVAFVAFPREPDVVARGEVAKGKHISRPRLDLLRESDALSHQMLREKKLDVEVWQFPVVLVPLTLGKGETIALRPVSSSDAMTARHANLPMEFIESLAQRLGELQGIDMVLYDVTDKPPATIEWE